MSSSRNRLSAFAIVFWFLAPSPTPAEQDLANTISKEQEIPGAKTYMVPMRDGTKLATDVTLPRGNPDQKYAAVLIRTPYNRRGLVGKTAVEAIPKLGFAAVVQDMRGRFGSEGEDFPIFGGCGRARYQDGYDTIEWIAQQPWCAGKVATIGPSAMGITQNLMLPTQPPHLKCAFVMVAAGDMYSHGNFWGGAPRKFLADNWVGQNRMDTRNLDLYAAHPSYDEFWEFGNTIHQANRVIVPVLYYGGWYDMFCQGTIDSFIATQNHGGPGAKGKCRLIMGPWEHGGLPQGLNYPPHAAPKLELWALEWLMKNVRDADITGGRMKPVLYYVMGACGEEGAPGNVWRQVDTWPVPHQAVAWYFHKGGLLSTDPPAETGTSLSYDFDPRNPVETLGGGNLILKRGPMDQRPVEGRPDVLLFSTPPLTEPIEVTGRITVKLWASSSCPDTDFTGKLCDVYPDGRSMIVQDGIVRARYRQSLSEPTLIEPGKIYPFEIDLWSTSIVFNKGHRIRVAISSSNAPRFDPNPNTGASFDYPSDKHVVAKNTIYLDKDRPSHIILPQPADATATTKKP